MLVTPKQARQNMCPLLMQGFMAAHPGKKIDIVDTLCRAGDCMAWRNEDETNEKGFCGLAGSPVYSQILGNVEFIGEALNSGDGVYRP